MNELLKSDRALIDSILSQTLTISKKYFTEQDTLPPSRFIPDIDFENLPAKGIGAQNVLDYFENNIATKLTNSAGSRYFGFVTGGSTPAAVAGDWLVSTYDQNTCGSNDSMAPQIERQTIHFFKQLFGLDQEYFGSFVTGATISNMLSLALARQWAGDQMGIDVSEEGQHAIADIKIICATPHSSILKSLSMLGVGRKSVVKIDTLPDREAIDISKLEMYFKQNTNKPLVVVANAGTVNTVDFDDLEAIAKLKSSYPFWLHVDAAFGGFAAVSEKYKHLMNGINASDSICIDAHKWLNVPYDAAMQFTRHKNIQLKVFQNSAAYLGDPNQSPDYFHYTPENSRRWRALPSWFTLMAYGKEGHQEIVERNCAMAQKLGEWLAASTQYKLLAPVRMNVVCFTLNDLTVSSDDVKTFLNKVRDDGRVFFTPTIYKGVPGIRAAISNWQTESRDIAIAITVLKELAESVPK